MDSDGRVWTFANFRIRDVLDVDLVSTTYRATTVDGDESRRLRVFTGDPADAQVAEVQAAVVSEALRARSVRHPHILAIHHADRHDDRVYVVSDDIHGAVLRDFIAHRHPLRTSTALAMAWQLAEALDAVHAGGVVHGSINPHTIWVADSPGRDVPMTYLTGFGAARAIARHLTSQNGSPTSDDLLYVEPDQAHGDRASPEADRYALACAVYHLMTGVPPFRRGTVNAQLGAHRFTTVEPASSVRDDLPPALDSVFARALAKEPSARYPSASALMIAVERGLRGQEETRVRAGDVVGGPVGGPVMARGGPAVPAGTPPPRVDGDAGPSPEVAPETAGTPADVPRAVTVDDGPVVDDAPPAVGTVADDRPAAGAAADDLPAGGAAADDLPAGGAAADDVPAGGAAADDVPAGGAAADDLPAAAATDVDESVAGPLAGEEAPVAPAATPAEPNGPLERRRAAALGARRATWRVRDDMEPAIAFPRQPPVAPAESPAGWRSALRAFTRLRPGVLAVVAGVLVLAVAGTVALVSLRDDVTPAPSQDAVPGSDAERDAQPAPVRPLWTASVGGEPVRTVEVTDEAVLVEAETTIGALDPTSGTRLWTKRAPARVTDVALLHGVVAVRTAEGVDAYDARTGRAQWTLSDAQVDSMAVVAGDGAFYAAGRDAAGIVVSAIDPGDGAVEPLATIPDTATVGAEEGRLALAFAGGSGKVGPTVYLLTRATLYAFDPEARIVRWRAPVRDNGRREAPRLRARPWVESLGVAAGAVVVVDREGRVCRHAAASGEQVWTTCPDFARVDAAPTLLVGGGHVMVASSEATALYDFTTGSLLWRRAGADGVQSAVAGGSGVVYVAREDGVVDALDHASGRERWRASEVGEVTALAADDDGVFAGLADGGVVRLVQRTVGRADGP